MPLVLLALVLIAILASIALLPFSLVWRYRAGTARRAGRGWVASVNVAGLLLSVIFVLTGAAVTSVWVPAAFGYALAGLAAGCVLGLVGLAVSRWESTPDALYYTPNRFLVLAITLVVTGRIAYGFWRGWETWHTAPDNAAWLAAAGAAGSMAAGALVLGYYLVYWAGVSRRLSRHRQRYGRLRRWRG